MFSSSRMETKAASCQEDEEEEEEEPLVGLPRPKHMQFVTRLRVDGGISS